MRVYQVTVRNKAAALVVGAAALVIGGALVAISLTLFAGLALGGAALGAGAVIVRRLTGRSPLEPLDPAQEVFASQDLACEHRLLGEPAFGRVPPASKDALRRIEPAD